MHEQLQAYATVLLQDAHLEVLIGFENGLGVIDAGAGVEDGQRTLAEEFVRASEPTSLSCCTSRWDRVSRLPLGLTEALIT